MPKSLVITADDYGFTAGINRGIEACVAAGNIQSVCVMANMPFWREIEALAAAHPELSVGVHWNVTQGRPVLSTSEVPSLLDSGGEFLSTPLFRSRFRRKGVALRELEAELEAQVSLLREATSGVAYWNTHQDVHLSRGLYARFAEIGRRLGVNTMRSHARVLARGGKAAIGYYTSHPVFWLKSRVLSLWAARASRRGTALPIGRIVAPEYRNAYADVLPALRGTEWEGTAELVCHPAATLEGLHGLTRLLETRLTECAQFSERDLPARMAALGIRLVSFANVTKKGS